MKHPLISVIIVGFNVKHFLKECLNSLLAVSYKNKEIIFVDNGSNDASRKFVKKQDPKIIVLRNEKNLGFAQGNNIGFQKAKGDAILLLNSDTIVEKNFLDELVDALYKEKNIGAAQPKIIMYPQKNQIDSIGSFFLRSGFLYHFGREKDPRNSLYNKSMDIFSAKGACMLIKRETLKKTELFDKDYFAYFEETDLCMRIWLAGYRVRYIPTSVVYHKSGTTNKAMRESVVFHGEKNRLCSYIKNLSLKYLIQVLPVVLCMLELEALIYFFIRKNLSCALAIEKSILWNIIHFGETLKKRRHIQRHIRAVSDDSFLPALIKTIKPIYYYYLMIGLNQYKD